MLSASTLIPTNITVTLCHAEHNAMLGNMLINTLHYLQVAPQHQGPVQSLHFLLQAARPQAQVQSQGQLRPALLPRAPHHKHSQQRLLHRNQQMDRLQINQVPRLQSEAVSVMLAAARPSLRQQHQGHQLLVKPSQQLLQHPRLHLLRHLLSLPARHQLVAAAGTQALNC